MARGNPNRASGLAAAESGLVGRHFGKGPVTKAEAAQYLSQINKGKTLHGDFNEQEDARVHPDKHETSQYRTMDDTRRRLLGRDYNVEKLEKSPYAKQVLSLSKEDVRKMLADKDFKGYLMKTFAKSVAQSNLVNRDKFGNWFAKIPGQGSRSWVADGDYDAVANLMLDDEEAAKRILDFVSKA